ncbi:MAG TPA: transglutaminase domain-containing protein [bacterium]|nr:transglutaminase domain-containing protein [bacterium]
MTHSKRMTRVLACLFFLLLLANLYVFLTREWESSFYPTSYATLYYPADIPTIRKWKVVDRNHLQLFLHGQARVTEWQVYTDGGRPQRALGMSPSFQVDTTFAQLHAYRLVPVPADACPAVEVTMQFYSREFYGSLGMRRSTDAYIVRSNVPCGEFRQFALQEWVDDYAYVGRQGLDETDRLLREEVGIRQNDATFVRMEKLTRYLRIKLKDARGVPKDDERWMNPWLLYQEMARGTGKGWCTQHAQIYVYWANRAGIPTRFVFGARTEDNTIVYTGHAFAESFIKEQNRWAFVDLAHAHIYITDKNGLVLNAAQLFHLNQHNAFDGVRARLYMDWEWPTKLGLAFSDTVVTVPYPQCNETVRNEFTSHSILKYRRPPNVEDVREIYTGFLRDRTFLTGNLERYLCKPQLAYSLYPTEGVRTYAIRRILFAALAASLLLWLFFSLYQRKRAGAATRARDPVRW